MKASVFLLDDDVQFTGMLKKVAENLNYRFQVFNDARQFLHELPELGVLILDLQMPTCDGIEVIRVLAERYSKLQLVLISGYDDGVLNSARTLAEAHKLTVLATFTKPVDIHGLKKVLDQAIVVPESAAQDTGNQVSINKTALVKALQENQFYLEYQPQFSLKDNAVVSFEALVRWQHPHFGNIYPDAFIPLAESINLISEITKKVIMMAFLQVSRWQQQNKDWNISINISAKDLLNIDLPAFLDECEACYQVAPQKVMLELTESAATGSLTDALETLNRLRLKGYRLSVDDFGTGYSSLSKLHDAPFNELKIDRKFVSTLVQDSRSLAIVKTCTALAKMLGMQIVAEGVEDESTLKALRAMQCDLIQGYFIGKPVAASQIEGGCRRVS